MAKELKSSKASAKHMIQHTSNTQGGAEVNILRHNHTSLPPKKKESGKRPNPTKGISHSSKGSHSNSSHTAEIQTSVLDVVTLHTHKNSTVLHRSSYAKTAIRLDTSPQCTLQKMHKHSHSYNIKVSQTSIPNHCTWTTQWTVWEGRWKWWWWLIHNSISNACSTTENCE